MAWRWWPFGDRASTPAPPGGSQRSVSRRDWAALPCIQRVVGPTRLTAESTAFARALPGHRPLEVALASLGHLRSPEAPAGLLVARASATTYQPASSGLLELLRPRTWVRPAGPEVAEPEAEVSFEPEQANESLVEPVAPSPGPASPVAMRLAQVVPVADRPAPVLPSLTLAPPLEHERPAPAAVPVSTPVEQAPVAPLPSEARPAGARLNLGQSRRLGLGGPASPPLPILQRRTPTVGETPDQAGSSGTAPVEAVAREVAPSSTEPSTAATSPAPFRAGPHAVPPVSPRVTKPIVRVQRRAVDAPPPPLAQVPATPAGDRPVARPEAPAPPSPTTPSRIEEERNTGPARDAIDRRGSWRCAHGPRVAGARDPAANGVQGHRVRSHPATRRRGRDRTAALRGAGDRKPSTDRVQGHDARGHDGTSRRPGRGWAQALRLTGKRRAAATRVQSQPQGGGRATIPRGRNRAGGWAR